VSASIAASPPRETTVIGPALGVRGSMIKG
jgi:hypothetical protein